MSTKYYLLIMLTSYASKLPLSLSLINSSTARVASISSTVLNQPSVLKTIRWGAESGGEDVIQNINLGSPLTEWRSADPTVAEAEGSHSSDHREQKHKLRRT